MPRTERAPAKGRAPPPAASLAIGLLLVPRFSMIAFTAAIEPLRLANRVAGRDVYAWRVHSADGRPVTASNGVRVEVDGAWGDVGALGAVFVCSGIDVQRLDHRRLVARLRALAARGVAIGAVCTGTHVLARAGLLDGRRCTIHWENRASLTEEFPHLTVSEELFEIDGDRLTCAGGTAAIDMMLSMIRRQQGPRTAALVADQLIHHRIREAHETQRMALRARLDVPHPKLLAAVTEMERSLETPLAEAALARRVGLSPRQLQRLFRRHLGEAPARYYLGLRLDRARALLRQTSMPVLAIGLACGFATASHFSRSYRARFGRTPTADRSAGG